MLTTSVEGRFWTQMTPLALASPRAAAGGISPITARASTAPHGAGPRLSQGPTLAVGNSTEHGEVTTKGSQALPRSLALVSL